MSDVFTTNPNTMKYKIIETKNFVLDHPSWSCMELIDATKSIRNHIDNGEWLMFERPCCSVINMHIIDAWSEDMDSDTYGHIFSKHFMSTVDHSPRTPSDVYYIWAVLDDDFKWALVNNVIFKLSSTVYGGSYSLLMTPEQKHTLRGRHIVDKLRSIPYD